MFKIGDRVIYVSDRWILGPSNPLKGSHHFCEGTIGKISSSRTIYVNWDNGMNNGYSSKDLELTYDPFRDLQDFIEKELRI